MSDGSMEQSLKSSHLAGGNLDYLDELYECYLADSNSVPNEWRQYFDSLPRVEGVIAGDVASLDCTRTISPPRQRPWSCGVCRFQFGVL